MSTGPLTSTPDKAQALPMRPTLPGRDYHDPSVFELERRTIFHGIWMCVGREEQLPKPGDYLARELIDESVVIVRDESGRLGAFYNVCRHRGSRLCDEARGSFGGAIRCPYHSWTYSLQGGLIGIPNVGEVEGFDRKERGLRPVALDLWEGFIFVNLAPRPAPLAEQLGRFATDYARYRIGGLRVGRSITYDVQANWKIVAENYNECLHCPGVHPELVKIVPIYRKGLVTEVGRTGVFMKDGATTFTDTGRSSLEPLPGLSDDDRRIYDGFTIFPNLMINLHSDSVMSYIVWPVSPERTVIVSDFLFEPSTIARDGFDPDDLVSFWDRVGRQDWTVCERVQKGVRSRAYGTGVYPPHEQHVYEFNQEYLRWRGKAPEAR